MSTRALPFRKSVSVVPKAGVTARPGETPHPGWTSRISPSELEEYRSLERLVLFDARTTLFAEGDESECLFRVVEGQVKVSINSSSGRRLTVAMAGPGELLDLASVITRRPYCVTVETVNPAVLAQVSSEKFHRFLALNPKLYELLIGEMVAQHNVFCGTIRLLGLDTSVHSRLARLLLQWCQSSGVKIQDGVRISVALTHEEIGEFIGASRETITRALAGFRERRLVEVHGSTIFIPNLATLAHIAAA